MPCKSAAVFGIVPNRSFSLAALRCIPLNFVHTSDRTRSRVCALIWSLGCSVFGSDGRFDCSTSVEACTGGTGEPSVPDCPAALDMSVQRLEGGVVESLSPIDSDEDSVGVGELELEISLASMLCRGEGRDGAFRGFFVFDAHSSSLRFLFVDASLLSELNTRDPSATCELFWTADDSEGCASSDWTPAKVASNPAECTSSEPLVMKSKL